jgi:hypothetical protein
MQKDERDLLEVLKFELEFLERGGYGRFPISPWRPRHIFEDSPTCMNYDSKKNPGPCSDCVLTQLVPLERRSEKIPCRHIPFNASGETLEALYQHSDQYEIEETVGKWLRANIQSLEEQRTVVRWDQHKQPTPPCQTFRGTPLYQEQDDPKCANPACPTAFHWTAGGKFFRFRPDPISVSEKDSKVDLPRGIHGVRHYWLCERCSPVFTLAYDEGYGAVLKLMWPEVPVSEAAQEVLVATTRRKTR